MSLERELFMAAFGMPAGDIDAWVVDRMVSILEEDWIAPGQVLFREGEAMEWIHFMREGEVRLTRTGAPPWILRGRWVLGAFESMSDVPRTRTATAITEINAMRAPVAAWLDLLEDSFLLTRAAVMRAAFATATLEERVPMMDHHRAGPSWSRSLPAQRALSLVERLAVLADVRILSGAGVQSVVDLATACTEHWFDAGQTVLARGVDRSDLWLVVQGEVTAARRDPDVSRRYGPGDIVCGAAAFGTPARSWEATAATRSRVMSFPLVAWFDLMEEHFDVVRSTLGALGARRELLLEELASTEEALVLT